MSEALSSLPGPGGFSLLEAFAPRTGFRADARFTAVEPPPPATEPEPAAQTAPEPLPDPVAEAFALGYENGRAEAATAAQAATDADEAARRKLELSLVRLDKTLGEEMRLRLRDTVAALCEAAIMPLALDEEALLQRIDKALAMLARADDERTIRLHPEDIRMISDRMRSDWNVEPDPTLARGELRVESHNGGIEDGPASWRRAIAEALHQV